jgi:Ca-activated chloride channel homolog
MSLGGVNMKKLTVIVLAVIVVAIAAGVLVKMTAKPETVKVVHWINGHLMRPGLLNEMSAQFNSENRRTASGKRIEVVIYNHGSAEQSDDLASRVSKGIPTDSNALDPTIVTPSSADWLVRANEAIGHDVVDIPNSKSICQALVGIVTYQDMAETLGWPNKEIGYADIIALRNDPSGWAAYPSAKAEWGQKPLFAFTDPITSTTGRSVLFSLYAIAAQKTPSGLTMSDVADPGVVEYVKTFQGLIDHYMIGTIPLNTKVYQGPKYGHFFLMPEDNLIHLYMGGEQAILGTEQVKAPPIEKPMVMIYPKEGSMIRNNIAAIVKAPWVTEEQAQAADLWIDYLRKDEQQRAFMEQGFRPGTSLSVEDPRSKITARYGLVPYPRTDLLSPELINPDVAAAVEKSWPDVKKPGIVTFAIDVSGSMSGAKLDQVKKGMSQAISGMAPMNRVGLLPFSTDLGGNTPVSPLAQNKYSLDSAVQKMRVQGQTALYDAVKKAIEMTDAAPGDPNAIRGVVVLTDGRANTGVTGLDSLVEMYSKDEHRIREFRGFEGDVGFDETGRQVERKDIIGTGLAIKTQHPIQIFFIGIGKDADIEVGRILAEASGAEFQGVADKDLASLIAQFSIYF